MILKNKVFGPLKLEKDDKVFIVSDLHINHDKDFIWKKRAELITNFKIKSVKDYNTYILRSLEELAYNNPDAYLISLGDNCFNDKEGVWAETFTSLPFKHIYSLIGNHPSGMKQVFGEDFEHNNCTLIPTNIEFQYTKYDTLLLSHLPLLDIPTTIFGVLCGHCHGDMECLNAKNSTFGRIFDCGVDNALKLHNRIWFTFDEAKQYLYQKKEWNEIQLHKNR